MNRTHSTGVHPGEVLKDELTKAGISQSTLARHIGVLPKTINEICRGKRGISPEMAVKLCRAFGCSPQFWMNLQVNWEIGQVDETVFANIRHIAPGAMQAMHAKQKLLPGSKRPSTEKEVVAEWRMSTHQLND